MRSHAKAVVAVSAVLLLTLVLGASTAAAIAPTATIDPPTDASYTSVKASGEVDPGDQGTYWSFETSTDGGASWSGFGFHGYVDPSEVTPGEGKEVNFELTGLAPGKPHELRLTAWNFSDPEAHSAVESFTTLPVAAPTVTLDPVSGIGPEAAQLSGEVDPNGTAEAFNASCRFEYLTDAAYRLTRAEVQKLIVKASGGTYTLTYKGQQTAAIAHNATPGQVQVALEALPNLELDFSVSGGPGSITGNNPYLVTFPAANPEELSADPAKLTGPAIATTTTVTNGTGGEDEVQQLTVDAIDGTFVLTFDGQSTAAIDFDAEASAVQSALEALGKIGTGNVSVSGGPGGPGGWSPYSIAFTGALAATDVKQVTVNSGGLVGSGQGWVEITTEGRAEGFEGATVVPCDVDPVTGSAQPVELELTGLEPSFTYHVRLWAGNAGGANSAETSFTTVSIPPSAVTHLVANLRSTSTRLTGFTDPHNQPTTYFFEWGKEADLSDAQSLPASEDASAGSGGQQLVVAEEISGLTASTTYYFRLVTDSPVGPPTVGETEAFTTRPTPPPPGSEAGAYGDRVVELVSDADANGNPVRGDGVRFTADGTRALWTLAGGKENGFGGNFPTFLAERTPSGWRSRDPMPTTDQWPFFSARVNATNPGLTEFVLRGAPPVSVPGNIGVGRWNSETRGIEILEETSLAFEQSFSGDIASDDLAHVFTQSSGAFDPADTAPDGGLYDIGSGTPELVGLLPGEQVTPCGVGTKVGSSNEYGQNLFTPRRWVSTDGRRLIYLSRGTDCEAAYELYFRQASPSGGLGRNSGAVTTMISEADSGPQRGAVFLNMAADGSEVFFVTETSVSSDDLNSTSDIYRFVAGSGSECLTCFIQDADVRMPASSTDAGPILVARNGARVYFTSTKVLAPGARQGLPSIYVLRVNEGELDFVAAANVGKGDFQITSGPSGAEANPDGSVLLFRSDQPDLDPLTGTLAQVDGGGGSGLRGQYYRYDDRDRSIECVSCLSEGPTTGETPGAYMLAYYGDQVGQSTLSADGRTLAFLTTTALVPDDLNNTNDVYEWRDGRIARLTEARSERKTGASGNPLVGVSPSGNDIFFTSPNDFGYATDGNTKLYDARVGGMHPPVPSLPCGGEGCKGAPTSPPADTSAGTAGFSSPGNPPAARCKAPKKLSKGRCVKPKKRKPGKRKARNAGSRTRGSK